MYLSLFALLISQFVFMAAQNLTSNIDASKICSAHHRGFESFANNNAVIYLTSTQIEGSIPSDLRVSIFYNGPGRNDNKGEPYGHWFDGDSLITKISVDGNLGRIEVRSR